MQNMDGGSNTTSNALAMGGNHTESDLSDIRHDKTNQQSKLNKQGKKGGKKKSRNKVKTAQSSTKTSEGGNQARHDEDDIADPEVKRQNDMILDEVERHDADSNEYRATNGSYGKGKKRNNNQ